MMYKKNILTMLFVCSSLFVSAQANIGTYSGHKPPIVAAKGSRMNLLKLTVKRQLDVINEVSVTYDSFGKNLIIEYILPAENISIRVINTSTRQTVYSKVRSVKAKDSDFIDLNNLEEGVYELILDYSSFLIVGALKL